MTAINVIRQRDCVHILTDGGAFNADGSLAYETAKVWPLPHLNAAVAFRGSPMVGPLFLFYLPVMAKSFDGLRDAVVLALQSILVHGSPLIAQSNQGLNLDCVVAGISESAGSSSFIVSSHDRYGEPWSIIDLGACGLTPTSPEMMKDFAERFPPGTSTEALEIERDGVAILEMQRRHHPGMVGGFVQHTEITADGIRTRIIHRWPDEAGKPITPRRPIEGGR